MDHIRVVIVDDEPPALAKMRRLLRAEEQVHIVGEASSGAEAVACIAELQPDVVFLDVQMPGMDGFQVVDALAGETLPEIVFATAFDEYAVRAFQIHAVDYLLKPFHAARLRLALARVRQRLAARAAAAGAERIRQAVRQAQAADRPLTRLLVRTTNGAARLLCLSDVDWIEVQENYVRLHTGDDSYLVRGTLAGLEERLDPDHFVRVHRSHIVNLESIRELHPWSHGDWRIVLHCGRELSLSRRFRDRLPELARV
jgi:two-component system, LytTR family, response regulator